MFFRIDFVALVLSLVVLKSLYNYHENRCENRAERVGRVDEFFFGVWRTS